MTCMCGHSEGVHFHTNNLASCSRAGCKCMKYRPVPEKEKKDKLARCKETEEPVGQDLLTGTHVRDRTT